MSELHRAIAAQRDAFRPDRMPAFASLVERRRRRDRRTYVVGAGLSTAVLVGLLVVVPTTGGGPDTLGGTPAAPMPSVDPVDQRFGSRLVTAENLASDHVAGAVVYPDYPARPPLGGEHSPLPQQCAVYPDQVPAENAVHSLEHGASWVTYRPDLAADEVERLAELVLGDPYRLMSPLPGQDSPILLTSWGRQLPVENADDPLLVDFLDTYTNGPLTPEPGAQCVGSTATGTAPVDSGGTPAR